MHCPAARMSPKRVGLRTLYWTVCALLTALILARFLCNPGIDGYGKAMLLDMVYGRAYKPYVTRALLPGTVRLLTSAIPTAAKRDFEHDLGQSASVRATFKKLKWNGEHPTEYLFTVVLLYAALFGFVLALRYLMTGIYRAPELAVDLVPLIALLCLPPFFRYYSYVYDFPTLCLFTLGLAFLVRARWTAFMVLYPFACLNKETTLLLTLLFVAYEGRNGRISPSLFRRLLVVQLGMYGLIKLGLTAVFRGNPGGVTEFQLLHNLELVVFPYSYSISTAFTTLGVALMLFYGWARKPEHLKKGFWILPVLLGLTFFLGYLDELRDYYEAYPIILLLLFHTAAEVLQLDVTVRTRTTSGPGATIEALREADGAERGRSARVPLSGVEA
jgi:hypothetical protein